ncbi:70-kilodalton heat shock protein [Mortierella sp. AD094]|nr:70-kilodalton heat shock protein [Mortierella sp. AD094]
MIISLTFYAYLSVLAIGIDLGTTYSRVAVWKDHRVEIIANDKGNRSTPSYVAFTESDRLLGDDAKDQVTTNPGNTIFGAKRLIGRRFNNVDAANWPFKVIEKETRPCIQVECKGEKKNLTPEEISSIVLIKMRKTAEAYLGTSVTDAVVTVPANFNDSQRQATLDAGKIAGLNILRIVDEPTAAAIAYDLKNKTLSEKNIFIYRLGGGTFEVSLLSIEEGIIEVKATAGDTQLGGEDINDLLISYFADEFKQKHGKDLSTDPSALNRLRTACERAKCSLSSSDRTTIDIGSLFDGIDFNTSLTRIRFEELCSPIFQKTLFFLDKVHADAGISKSQVDEIVLIGGSTRIPSIQKMVSEFYNGKELNVSIDPEESAVYGAAIWAAVWSGDTSEEIQDLALLDVAPLSIGVENAGGVVENIIMLNSTVPAKETKIFTTFNDNTSSRVIQVYEGEGSLVKDNHLLGTIIINGILPAPRGVPEIFVTFRIDANGVLDVSASQRGGKINVTVNKSGLSKEDIERMTSESGGY